MLRRRMQATSNTASIIKLPGQKIQQMEMHSMRETAITPWDQV